MRKLNEKLLLYVAPLLTSLIIRFIRFTSKVSIINEVDVNKEQIILAFWHGRMLMIPIIKKERPASVMISRHRDGELISRTMKRFGIDSTRGSTTRGGISALKDMIRLAAKGYSIVFTPDGPKGPRYVAQIGAIQAAKATGLPIYPVTYGARKKKTLGSWDGFIIPYPFNDVVIIYGNPIIVNRDADKDVLEDKRRELEASLRDITEQADSWWDRPK